MPGWGDPPSPSSPESKSRLSRPPWAGGPYTFMIRLRNFQILDHLLLFPRDHLDFALGFNPAGDTRGQRGIGTKDNAGCFLAVLPIDDGLVTFIPAPTARIMSNDNTRVRWLPSFGSFNGGTHNRAYVNVLGHSFPVNRKREWISMRVEKYRQKK